MPLLAELRQRGKAPSGGCPASLRLPPAALVACRPHCRRARLGVQGTETLLAGLYDHGANTTPCFIAWAPAADEWLKGEYDTKQQAELCNKVAVDLGFSLEHGRLDVSVHPFTGGEAAPAGRGGAALTRTVRAVYALGGVNSP